MTESCIYYSHREKKQKQIDDESADRDDPSSTFQYLRSKIPPQCVGLEFEFGFQFGFGFKFGFEFGFEFGFKFGFKFGFEFWFEFEFWFKFGLEFKFKFEFALGFEFRFEFQFGFEFGIQLTATDHNKLQRITTDCKGSQKIATNRNYRNGLLHIAMDRIGLQWITMDCNRLQ